MSSPDSTPQSNRPAKGRCPCPCYNNWLAEYAGLKANFRLRTTDKAEHGIFNQRKTRRADWMRYSGHAVRILTSSNVAAMRRGAEVQRVDQFGRTGAGMLWEAAFECAAKRRAASSRDGLFRTPDRDEAGTRSQGLTATEL